MTKFTQEDLDRKILIATERLLKAKRSSQRQLIAFSGGKDAIVTAHLAVKLGIKDAVCEVSWYFERQTKCVKQSARELGLNCVFKNSVPEKTLRKKPGLIFSSDSKVRGWSFSVRQQRTVKKHAAKYGYDCQIFGRRTEENSVKAPLYTTKAGLQCHPIREWTEKDVWAYFDRNNIRIPWIYHTDFGKLEGNGPFYALNRRHVGGVANAWNIVESLDPRYNRERFPWTIQ